MEARFGVVITALAAMLAVEVVVLVLGRSADVVDVLGGLVFTVAGMAVALLAQGMVRAALSRAPRTLRSALGVGAHTAVAAYTLLVVGGVDAAFGWLLGVLLGAIIGAAMPSFAFGPVSGWASAVVAARIAAFVGLALLLQLPG